MFREHLVKELPSKSIPRLGVRTRLCCNGHPYEQEMYE